MKSIDGKVVGRGRKIAIVAARFNAFIVERLVEGALAELTRAGVDDVIVVRVPGAFEIPAVARRLIESGKYGAVICLGCVIRGATPHFDYVCNEVSRGIADLAMTSNVPVIFGVLTTENIEQAVERAGEKVGNKGVDAAVAALEMISVYEQLGSEK